MIKLIEEEEKTKVKPVAAEQEEAVEEETEQEVGPIDNPHNVTAADINKDATVETETAAGDVEEDIQFSVEEVDEKASNIACEEIVSNLMQQCWDFISGVNSVIATLDANYMNDLKEDIIGLLNVVVDDSTITVGMLQKIVSTMDERKIELLDAGEDKVDEILKGLDKDSDEDLDDDDSE